MTLLFRLYLAKIGASRVCLILFILLPLVLGSGCQQGQYQQPDSSKVVVTPGLGVSNRYEVGMTVAEIRKSFPDAIVHRGDKHSRWILIPSLGATSFLGEGETVSHITFHIDSCTNDKYSGFKVNVPFRGRLGDRLNFGSRDVPGQEVQSAYGPLLKRSSVTGDSIILMQQADPFSRSNRVSEETWYYPAVGVAFVINSNRVHSFEVFHPTVKSPYDKVEQ